MMDPASTSTAPRAIPKRLRQSRLSPPLLLAASFLLLIALGTVLLKLPFATTQPITWLQAAFTATSAVTVTGLGVVDTGTMFTRAGQTVIALLIQAGGLGFMTFAVLILMRPSNRKVAISHQLVAKEALGNTSLHRLGNTARAVVGFALTIELIAMLLLAVMWAPEMGWGRAFFEAFFHSLSAFNNAGFALYGDGLSRYVGHWGVNLVVTSLIILGGLGFLVMMDLKEKRFRWSFLQTNTKIMVLATLGLNLLAAVLFFMLEYHHTLKNLPLPTQIIASWFQAVSPRTAGFNTLPVGDFTAATSVLVMLLMFIGAGSMSTASGVKIGTMVVLTAAILAFLRQREQVMLLGRNVPLKTVMKALAVVAMAAGMAFAGIFVLSILEPDKPFLDVAFEVVSALGTVGLTRNLTPTLSPASQMVVMLLMFTGRVGALTLVYTIATPKPTRIRYPDTHINIG